MPGIRMPAMPSGQRWQKSTQSLDATDTPYQESTTGDMAPAKDLAPAYVYLDTVLFCGESRIWRKGHAIDHDGGTRHEKAFIHPGAGIDRNAGFCE